MLGYPVSRRPEASWREVTLAGVAAVASTTTTSLRWVRSEKSSGRMLPE